MKQTRLILSIFFLITLFVTFLFSPSKVLAIGQWSATGSMISAHGITSMTSLPDGKVLVVSGGGNIYTSEIYDPATSLWTQTGSVNQPRDQFNPILLNNGKVLIAGGISFDQVVNTAEIYDPATGQWIYTGNLNEPRTAAILVKLLDGQVLAIGGRTSTSAEIYNPITGIWTYTGSLNIARAGSEREALLLNDGRVLVVGGATGQTDTAEIFDPSTGSWSFTTGNLVVPRQNTNLVKLQNGRVLMVDGINNPGSGLVYLTESEIFDPSTGLWAQTGSTNYARSAPATILLPDGRVLVAGGDNAGVPVLQTELFDPLSSTWTIDASTNSSHWAGNMALLTNGEALLVGGLDNNGVPTTAVELYTQSIRSLSALNPAKVWIGKGVLGIGVKFDLLAEVYKDQTLVSSGQVNSVNPGLGLGFNTAQLATIPFNTFSPVDFPQGSQLKIKLSVRNACSGSLLPFGTARLWFNDGQANSRFGATIASGSSDYFLRDAFVLATTVGAGPKKTIDVQAGAMCSPFKPFGTWTVIP